MDRRELPIYELEAAIVLAAREKSRLIVQAPTGSGKSTQVPQMLLGHDLLGRGEVVVLQPRRIAARMLAARVAHERDSALGGEVGYQVRFENATSQKTRIRFVTEGILLRQLINEPQLRGTSAIIFDEFHERHLYGDITLARALDLQARARPELKLLVMSATLDSAAVESFLEPAVTLTSRGRTFPVRIEFQQRAYRDDYPVWEAAADELERVAPTTEGDVLVFMPGKYEINRTIGAIRASHVSGEFVPVPLHGELPPADQDAALAAYGKRKVIVATNVAETSLTIPGVRVVIDSGLARIARYDARRGINTLLVEKISRASAEQRAGRAGRTAPGLCVRLWTEREHSERAAHELPEVKRLDLAEVVLTLKASGVDDVRTFRWLERPDPHALDRAERLLADLGATDGNAITPLGRRMLQFPVHPRYARMFLAAQEEGCVRAVALLAALTQGRPLLRRAEGKQIRDDRDDLFGGESDSDLFVLLRAFRFAENNRFDARRCSRLGINAGAAREAAQLFEQFLAIAQREGLDIERAEAPAGAIQRCVLAGFADQTAARLDRGTLRCALVHGRRAVLARESAVRDADLLVASEVQEIETGDKELQVLLTTATRIEPDWLRQMFPQAVGNEIRVELDPATRRVVARETELFHDLVLQTRVLPQPPRAEAAALLADAVMRGECQLKLWDHAVEQWIARVNFVAREFPHLDIAAIGEAEKALIIQQICDGAFSYKELKERPVWPALRSWLSTGQLPMIDDFAPERLPLPNGRSAKVDYAGDKPTVAVRIQDLYGVTGTLAIGRGRLPVRIQVLAPNHRPIQITTDLQNFWRTDYPRIKPELQRKYPKHEWR